MIDTISDVRRVFLAGTFLRWVAPGLLVPVLVLVLTAGGLDLAGVGVVFAVYGATTVILELPTGGLADAIGRRPILVAAGLLFIGFDLVLLFGSSLPVFVAGAFIGGAGRSLSSGPLESWFIDRVRAVDPTMVLRPELSRAGMLEGAALTVGALASAGLANLPGAVAGLPNVLVPILGAVVADVAFLTMIFATVREPDQIRRSLADALAEVPSIVTGGVRLALGQRAIRILLVTTTAVALGAVTLEVLWQPRYAEMLGGPEEAAKVAGLIVAGFAFATVVGSALAQRLPRRAAALPGPAAAIALVLAAVSVVGMALAGSPWPLTFGLLIAYGFLALSKVLRQELLHEWVPSGKRTTMVSVDSLAAQIGNVGASLVVVRIAGATSIPIGWHMGAVSLALGALVVSFAKIPPSRQCIGYTSIATHTPETPRPQP